MAKILCVMTGASYWTLKDGHRHPTGYWAEEFVAPYSVFTDAGHEVTVATPRGVVPVVDMMSLESRMAAARRSPSGRRLSSRRRMNCVIPSPSRQCASRTMTRSTTPEVTAQGPATRQTRRSLARLDQRLSSQAVERQFASGVMAACSWSSFR